MDFEVGPGAARLTSRHRDLAPAGEAGRSSQDPVDHRELILGRRICIVLQAGVAGYTHLASRSVEGSGLLFSVYFVQHPASQQRLTSLSAK
jgi:hypothetical protein